MGGVGEQYFQSTGTWESFVPSGLNGLHSRSSSIAVKSSELRVARVRSYTRHVAAITASGNRILCLRRSSMVFSTTDSSSP